MTIKLDINHLFDLRHLLIIYHKIVPLVIFRVCFVTFTDYSVCYKQVKYIYRGITNYKMSIKTFLSVLHRSMISPTHVSLMAALYQECRVDARQDDARLQPIKS